MEYLAKDYNSREDLEKQVSKDSGLTPDKKDSIIKGTMQELARLRLSSKTTFWGISCVATDEPPEQKPVSVYRGHRTDYGINKRNKKAK